MGMRITEVTHERVRNIGNYESARVSLTACMGNDDDLHATLATLKTEALAFLYPSKEDEKHDKPTAPDEDDILY